MSGSGFIMDMIRRNKANLAKRRKKNPFLGKGKLIDAHGFDAYHFPIVSEQEREKVRTRIKQEMERERIVRWAVGCILIILVMYLYFILLR